MLPLSGRWGCRLLEIVTIDYDFTFDIVRRQPGYRRVIRIGQSLGLRHMLPFNCEQQADGK